VACFDCGISSRRSKPLKERLSLALLAKNVMRNAMLHYISNTLIGLFGPIMAR
jgi:hypothetical protein